VPTKKGRENAQRRVLEEHYYILNVLNEVIVISGAVTNTDRESSIVDMLNTIANSIETYDAPIDLNQFRKR